MTNSTLVVIGLVVVLFIVARFAKKILYKVLSVVFIVTIAVFLMYQFGVGQYASNPLDIDNLKSKYCEAEEYDAACDCIVKRIERDVEARFTKREIEELKKSRVDYAYVFGKSYAANKKSMRSCLEERKAEEQLKEFQNDLLPVDNDVLNKVREFLGQTQDKIEEEIEEFKNRKSDLDSRY
jgi:hypothetical protein